MDLEKPTTNDIVLIYFLLNIIYFCNIINVKMDKLVRIILLVIGLTTAFLWLSKTFSSCSSSDAAFEEGINSDSENAEELFEGDEIDYSTSSVEDEPIQEEIVEDETGETNETVDFSSPAPVKPTRPASTSTSTSYSGSSAPYMIIAGNYLLKSNAEIMTTKLKDLGHSNAHVAIFDQSQYHTVIASRFNNYESAANSANALKRQGVDCYVKKRQ